MNFFVLNSLMWVAAFPARLLGALMSGQPVGLAAQLCVSVALGSIKVLFGVGTRRHAGGPAAEGEVGVIFFIFF